MQKYPRNIKADATDCADAINKISQLRDQDIIDRNNFPSIFLSGRTTGHIPSSATDISATDRVGDMSFATDASYVYFCCATGATPPVAWRRVALGSW